jgi:hypothetical protein
MDINQFMIYHNVPSEFRIKVKRYLDYLVDYKRQYKLEEEEVLSMLNENLVLELIINLNGKMLHNTPLFHRFHLQFLSDLTFALKKETFVGNEHIFEEGDEGSTVYFVMKGSVYIIHKQTQTFLKELKEEDYFGEIAFFCETKTRTASARSKEFSECLILDRILLPGHHADLPGGVAANRGSGLA